MLFGNFIEQTNAYNVKLGELKLTNYVISKNQKMHSTDLL